MLSPAISTERAPTRSLAAVLPPSIYPQFAKDALAWHCKVNADPIMCHGKAPFPAWLRGLISFEMVRPPTPRSCHRCEIAIRPTCAARARRARARAPTVANNPCVPCRSTMCPFSSSESTRFTTVRPAPLELVHPLCFLLCASPGPGISNARAACNRSFPTNTTSGRPRAQLDPRSGDPLRCPHRRCADPNHAGDLREPEDLGAGAQSWPRFRLSLQCAITNRSIASVAAATAAASSATNTSPLGVYTFALFCTCRNLSASSSLPCTSLTW